MASGDGPRAVFSLIACAGGCRAPRERESRRAARCCRECRRGSASRNGAQPERTVRRGRNAIRCRCTARRPSLYPRQCYLRAIATVLPIIGPAVKTEVCDGFAGPESPLARRLDELPPCWLELSGCK